MQSTDDNINHNIMSRVFTSINKQRLSLLLAAAAILLTTAAILISGCTDNGAGTLTIQEQGEPETAPTDESAVDSEGITNADLPADVGNRKRYAANKPGTAGDISFNLDGPWDFSDGPDSLTLTLALILKMTAPGEGQFPEATMAAKSSWEPRTGEIEYSFQEITDEAWLSYGHTGRNESMSTYSTPSRLLVFPATVDRSWVDVYERSENNEVAEIIAENEVIAFNRLTVPEGTFSAYLLQRKIPTVTNKSSSLTWNYLWIVPGIGMAAEVVSLPDERQEVFDNAYSFYRLKEY